jgi:hypothetical protein
MINPFINVPIPKNVVGVVKAMDKSGCEICVPFSKDKDSITLLTNLKNYLASQPAPPIIEPDPIQPLYG